MKDSVMKNIVFETSYIKNIEYDIDNISEVCQNIGMKGGKFIVFVGITTKEIDLIFFIET